MLSIGWRCGHRGRVEDETEPRPREAEGGKDHRAKILEAWKRRTRLGANGENSKRNLSVSQSQSTDEYFARYSGCTQDLGRIRSSAICSKRLGIER